MNMIKKIIKKYQSYRDKRFLARLERVLGNNMINATISLHGSLFTDGSVWMMFPTSALKDFVKGTPLSLIEERLHQGYYEEQGHLQSDSGLSRNQATDCLQKH